MEVHNITPDVIENQPSYSETSFSKKVVELNQKENYLIAHNIGFDLGMIEKEGFTNNYTLIDTVRCAKHLLPDSPCPSRTFFSRKEVLITTSNSIY